MDPQKTPQNSSDNTNTPGLDPGSNPLGGQDNPSAANQSFAGSGLGATPSGVPSSQSAGPATDLQTTPIGGPSADSLSENSDTEETPSAPDEPSAKVSSAASGQASSVVIGGTNPVSQPLQPPRRRKKGLIIGVIVAAVVLLLSGGAAASYYYYANRPENVLKQALANAFDMNKVATSKFSGTVSAENKDNEMGLTATFKGAANNKTGVFDISGSADFVVTNVNFDLRTPDAKTYYVRVGGLDGLAGLLGSAGADVNSSLIKALNNQWIEINESFLKQINKSWESGSISEADSKKIAQAYVQHPFLEIKEVLKDEVIKGQDSHHYKIAINPGELKAFFTALKDAKLDNYNPDQRSFNDFIKMVDKAKLDQYPLEIWISKSGKLITQIAFKASQDKVNFDLKFTSEGYNQPVDVKKPEGAKSILEIMSEFSGGLNLQSQMSFPGVDAESSDGISL